MHSDRRVSVARGQKQLVRLLVVAASSCKKLHDFTLSASPTSFTLPLGGTTETSVVTASALGDFGDEITLGATGHPSGVAVSFSANAVTPVAGTPATSTVTIAVGPPAIPQSCELHRPGGR